MKLNLAIGFTILVFYFGYQMGVHSLEDVVTYAYEEGQKSVLVEIIDGEIKIASR